MKLVGACMYFAACRSLAIIEQTNLTSIDHTADSSLSSPGDILMGEQ